MRYTIKNVKEKTWNGKNFKEADLIAENGSLFQVSAWNGEFDSVDHIETDLVQNDKGYWVLPKKPRGGAYNANKDAVIAKVMEKKEKSIERFQDSKEASIKLSSAQRDAVLMVTTFFQNIPNTADVLLKKEIIKWRNWFLLSEDFNEIPPFE